MEEDSEETQGGSEEGSSREVVALKIPLDGTSGLGVNVKGKIMPAADGSLREGIFVKSVLPDGAAAKVCPQLV